LTGRASAICAKRNYRSARATEQARVNAGKLGIGNANKFLVAWRRGAIRRRRCNSSADIISVAWMLAVRNCCSDEISLVCDARRFGKVDHVVSVILLIADASCRKQAVDPINSSELYAGVVRMDVTTAVETEILEVLCHSREVSLRGPPVLGVWFDTFNRVQPSCVDGSLPPCCVVGVR